MIVIPARIFTLICLSICLVRCSKDNDDNAPVEPVTSLPPDPGPENYVPVKSATYNLSAFDYIISMKNLNNYPRGFRLNYDSSGFQRSFFTSVYGDSAVITFEHLNFINEQSVESTDSIYRRLWRGTADTAIGLLKDQSIYFTNPLPNKMFLGFRNGAVITFNITSQTNIGPTVVAPYANQLRLDRKAAMEYFSSEFNTIQDADLATPGTQPKRWKLVITRF